MSVDTWSEDAGERKKVNSSEFLSLLKKYPKLIGLEVVDPVNLTEYDIPDLKEIVLESCCFKNEFLIGPFANFSKILFSSCDFKKRLLISNTKVKTLRIKRCRLRQYVAVKKLVSDSFSIESCKIDNKKEILLQEFETNELIVKKNEADNDIYLKPISVEKVIIEGGEKNYLITFSNLRNEQIIRKFYLFTYSNYRSNYLLRNFSSQELEIFGELKDSALVVSNINIATGVINHFTNLGVIKLSGINPLGSKSYIIIKNSSLAKTEISNCNFSIFNNVLVSDSSLIDLIPINITWCNTRNLKSRDLASERENFRQLKVVAARNEDIPTKLFFEKLEMHTYLNQLRRSNEHRLDRLILITNYYTNDFGLNWGRALMWLLVVSLICYTSIKCSLGYVVFDPHLILDEVGLFLLFLNPVHQFDKIFFIDPIIGVTNGAIFFDAVSRILGAYLIYQFVSSFRKFAKK